MIYNNFPHSQRSNDKDVQGILNSGLKYSDDAYEQFSWFNSNNISHKQSVIGMVQWTQDYFHSLSKTKVELTYSEVDNLMRVLHAAIDLMQEDVPDHFYSYMQQKTFPVLDDIVRQKYNNEK